jgi:hypothetical protein
MAAQAILALRMVLLHRTLPALDVAGQTVLLKLDTMVGDIAGHRRVIVSRRGQQGYKDDNGQPEADKHEVGFLQPKFQ